MSKTWREIQISKYMSKILRHHPELIGITLDEHGWADVDELIEGIARTKPLDMALLEKIVAEDEKQRYSFSSDKRLIRANQGHSVPVDVELEKATPRDVLFHGTCEAFIASIDQQGLLRKERLYVHLSTNTDTAEKSGRRHGKPFVYQVDAKQMHEDGYEFFVSVNGVWLTKAVPAQYLKKAEI